MAISSEKQARDASDEARELLRHSAKLFKEWPVFCKDFRLEPSRDALLKADDATRHSLYVEPYAQLEWHERLARRTLELPSEWFLGKVGVNNLLAEYSVMSPDRKTKTRLTTCSPKLGHFETAAWGFRDGNFYTTLPLQVQPLTQEVMCLTVNNFIPPTLDDVEKSRWNRNR